MAVIATGFFDGVHLGHRQVLQTLVSSARERGEEAVAVSFAQHPRAVLQQDARNLRFLTTREEKKEMIAALGVDRLENLPFTRGFAAMKAEEYIREVLVDRFGATALVLGYDTRMGSDKLGPDGIAALAAEMGLDVVRCAAVPGISSTKIRAALVDGDVERASGMLGYDYSLHGVVVGGKQLGRTIGYPTANMQMYEPLKLVPGRGAYLTAVEVQGGSYYGMTNVGDIVETHIFDFDEDIYGLDIRVAFKKRLRDERRFRNVDELRERLAIDEAACRSLCEGLSRQ